MTRPVINLYTSMDAFEALHRECDRRKGKVRFQRDDILNLLMDHSAMIDSLRKHGYVAFTKGEAPEPKPKKTKRLKLKAKPKRVRLK